MKEKIHARSFITVLLMLCLLAPTATFAFGDGKKHFNEGMKYEAAEQWDKAAEEFALAVADSPKNTEYRLHLARSLFNASQMFMKRGNTAAKDRDYEAAYVAFRRAYAFDPTNELAQSEMERMVRLQKDLKDGDKKGNNSTAGGVRLVQTGYNTNPRDFPAPQMPQKLEKLRDLPFPAGVDLQFIIKELARDLELNVLFDTESFRPTGAGQGKKTYIDLKNVTAAKALDYIFLQEGLFFQKVGPRTIIVANQAQRTKFQQLVLRTFYLANAAPKDVAKVLQTAIPQEPGRAQTTVLTDDATNSITIRDTSENIRLMGKLIASLDKDRAEVVMDVAIYEVNKNDLLQLGNQVGNASQLQGGLGGSSSGAINFSDNLIRGAATGTQLIGAALPVSIATGIILPSASLSAFQSKNNTRLLASTQIHAFNNEDSKARIGQRVPVRSASFQTGLTGQVQNSVGGVVSDVINYEQVGLTLNFKPIVFPNQDVQVTMKIESKDVTGAQTLTPTFTERTIEGTARVQNNKTLLLASVAQDVQSNGRQGLPLLGLIPILGRLFTAPTRDNRQVDIVIAVTPRVIRAPAILPEDEVERETGSLAVPTGSSLEAMIIDEERQEQFAAARRLSNTASVQLPDQAPAPEYVKTDVSSTGSAVPAATTAAAGGNAVNPAETEALKVNAAAATALKPIDNGVKTLQLKETANVVDPTTSTETKTLPAPDTTAKPAQPSLDLKLGTELNSIKAGEKIKVPIVVQGTGTFNSAAIGLTFNDKKLAVRNVTYGEAFGPVVGTVAKPFVNESGKMYVSLTAKDGKEITASGTIAYIEIEALVDGKPEISFDSQMVNFLTNDGKNFAVKLQQ